MFEVLKTAHTAYDECLSKTNIFEWYKRFRKWECINKNKIAFFNAKNIIYHELRVKKADY